MINIAIIDSLPIFRHGMERLLSDTGHMQVVASLDTVGDLGGNLADGEAGRPVEVAVVGVPDGDPANLRWMRQHHPACKLLAVLTIPDAQSVRNVLGAGAAGCITRTTALQVVIAAIKTVAAGGLAFSVPLAEVIINEPVAESSLDQGPPLSSREQQVLRYIANGLTHGQAATRMGVTKATVDTYVERIRRKWGAGNKADLTRLALNRLGTVSLSTREDHKSSSAGPSPPVYSLVFRLSFDLPDVRG